MEPEVGQVIDGYRFKGGDPAQESSWERVEPAGARLLPRARATGDRRSEEAYYGRRRTAEDPAVSQASEGVTAARRAEGLIRRQEAQGQGTGGIYGVPVVGTVAGFLDPEIRELNALQARQARLERQPGEGAISDFDAAQFVAMTYGADKPTETNRALIQAQRVANDARLQKREFDEWYWNTYGTTSGSQEAWRVYAQENPIFDPNSQRTGQARLNPSRQNWREYFTGESGFDTQAEIDARAAQSNDSAGPIDPATGLPTYPGITAMTEGYGEVPIGDPNKPGRSEANAIDILDPSVRPQDLPKILSDGGWIRRGDEAPYYIEPGLVRYGTEGQQVRPGLNVQEQEPERSMFDTFVEANRDLAGVVGRNIESASLAAAERVPFMMDAAKGLASALVPGSTRQDADAAHQRMVERDRRERPAARNVGGVVGTLAPMAIPGGGLVQGGRAIVSGAPTLYNAGRVAGAGLRMAGVGGATGAIYGAGTSEGDLQERVNSAIEGGVIGAVAAPFAGAAVNALARPVGRIVERVTQGPNPLGSAVDRYARRFKPDVNALSGRVDELEALGIQPAMIDVVDDARRGTYRALATRDTPAREQAVRLAQDRRANLPSRVRNMADQEVSAESRPTLDVIDELSATRRTNAGEGMAGFGNQAVMLNENAVQAVRSDLVRSALRDAATRAQSSLDPVERAGANRLAQLADTALDNPAQTQLTVREAQDISAALNAAADGAFRSNTPANGPVLQALGRAIRQSARDSSEDYNRWLRQYADDSQLMEAATTGRNFVQASTDPVSGRSTDAFVRQAQQATPPELAVQQAAARQAMEAQGASPTGARGVLEGFASNEDQLRRAAALRLDAGRLRARSAAELRQVENAQNISPRVGSQTGTNMADQAMEAGGALREAATGNLPGLLGRAGRLIMSRGFNDREAEALIQASIDPARTREVIEMLSQRMTRQEARNLVRSVRYMAGQQSGNAAARNDQ